MKKIILPVVAVMLCMTGCKKEQEGFLRLEVEHFNSDAKMHIDVAEDAAYSVWDDGDLVMVNGEVCTVSVNSNSAVIGNLPASVGGAYSAVYPASIVTSMSGNSATVKLPAVQQYRENDAGQQVVEVPMTAYCGSEDNTLSFHNLGSLLAVKVENTTGGAMNVWRIRVEADKPLSGTYENVNLDSENPVLGTPTNGGDNMVYLDFDEGVLVETEKVFYIALPPVTGAKFTIEVYSSNTMYQRSQSAATATFARNTAHEVPFSTMGATTANIVLYESTGPIEWAMVYESNVYDDVNKMGYFTISPQFFFDNDYWIWGFHGCENLTSIVVPEGVTLIDANAFSSCTSLTSIDIPSSVTSIGPKAFDNCISLTSIDIPSSVTSIGNEAFRGCSRLSRINCWPQTPPTFGSDVFSQIRNVITIHVLNGIGVPHSYRILFEEMGISYEIMADLHL